MPALAPPLGPDHPRPVLRLPQDPGPAGWNALLPPPPPPARLEDVRRADVAIVGAGFAGLAAARRLAMAGGLDVVVLEAGRLAEGPAGRNSGFMIDLPHDLSSTDYAGDAARDADTIADNRRAIAFAAQAVRDYAIPAEAFDPCGKINAAASQAGLAHNADYAQHLARLGERAEMLDAAQMREITGSRYYLGGLHTPGTVMLQPAMFIRALGAGLARDGVRIFEHSPVLTFTPQSGGSWRLATPLGAVQAGAVILAVNGHLESFGIARGRLMHVHTYASMTRALTASEVARLGGAASWGITPADPLGTTVRRISGTGGARIVIRNRFTFDPALVPARRTLARVAADHDRAFRARFPALAGVEMEYRWGGRLCLAYNGVQVIGEIAPGLFSACVQNGLGTVRGTLAGMLAAEALLGVDSPALARARSAPLPRRLPPGPLIRPVANARLRWGEWRAGAEL